MTSRQTTHKRVTATLLVITTLLSLFPTMAFAQQETAVKPDLKPLILQYDEAAPYNPNQAITSGGNRSGWERWALPLGNGHMGAMIFGGTDTERIQLNEKTLWSGGPGGTTEEVVAKKDSASDVFGNVDAQTNGAMDRYVEKIFTDYYNNQYTANPAQSGDMKLLPNHRLGLGTYTNFAELLLDLNHTEVTNYHRELDLRTGLSTVSHTTGGVAYTRKTFASYPDNVIVYQIAGNQPGSVSMKVRPEIPFNGSNGKVDGGDRGNDGRIGTVVADLDAKTIRLDGVMDNNMKFSGDFYVLPEGGTMTAENPVVENLPNSKGAFNIQGANSVTIIVALATNYKNEYPAYRQTDADHARKNVESRIAATKGQTFDALYRAHYADYDALFSRTELNLGGTYTATETTDQLLSTWKRAAAGARNHYLEELYFQYGRYMLIASSREDSLPANLQGIWADQKRPSWQSDYHTNINLQMNYWPAYTTNLAETGTSLLKYIDSLQVPGAVTAKTLYGVDGTWMTNCSANALGFTGNINSAASLASTASAFILQNAYDHYEFTQDKALLESTIYPMMKSACKLFTECLQPGRTELDKDRLFWAPSYSSEQGLWTVGAAFDQQLIYMLFADTVSAANELGVDAALVAQLTDMMARIYPVEIGLDGQIKEYQQEGTYLTDINTGLQIAGTEKGHRHNSMLMMLHPGDLINTETPEYMTAAEASLNLRGDGATGWSMGQKFNMWARLHDGNHAYDKLFVNLMKNGTATNLFDLHPPFQIDGNFGGSAGLVELLMQSHAGYIDILPALPDELPSGSVSGIVAEGNFVIDLAWANKKTTSLQITSRSANPLKIKAGAVAKVTDLTAAKEITDIAYNEDGSISFATERGHTYGFETGVANMTELAAKTAQFAEFTAYGYTGDTDAFVKLLTTARRVVEQGNCYLPTLSTLQTQLDAAYAALTARDNAKIGAVLALQLNDRVERSGISTEHQNAYRVYGGKIIAQTEALLTETHTATAIVRQGMELLGMLEQYGKNLAPRTELYTLLANLIPVAAGNAPLERAVAQAKTVYLNTDATPAEIAQATQLLKEVGSGTTDLWHIVVTAQSGGTITPTSELYLATGGGMDYTITPDAGYEIMDVTVNAKSVGSVNHYSLKDVREDTQIVAKFKQIITGTDEASALLAQSIRLAKSLRAEDYASFAAVQTALTAAEGAVNASSEIKTEKANALLLAVEELVPVSSLLGKVEAESQGINEAWNSSWASSKSGMPAEADVKSLIDAFHTAGKTIVMGYGEKGKTHSRPGSTNMSWENEKKSKFSGGGQLTTRAKDPWLEYTFTGNRIELITEQAKTACMAEVYIDNQLITTVDLSTTNASGLQQQLVFDSAEHAGSKNLTNGVHTLRIWAKDVGVVSDASKPYQILRVDAFNVYGVKSSVSKTELAKSLARAGAVQREIYSADTLRILDEKFANAQTIYLNAEATASEVTLAKGALDDAYAALGKATKTIIGVTNPVSVTVDVGTTLAALELPKTVVASTKELSGSATADVVFDVQWLTDTIDLSRVGPQMIYGRIVLPVGGAYQNPEEIKAVFAVDVQVSSSQTYRLKSASGAGGQISPRGAYEMTLGMSKTFSIVPDAGYAIFDVTLNGKSLGAVSSYTASNLTEDTQVEAWFEKVPLTAEESRLQNATALAALLQEKNYAADSWSAMQSALQAAKDGSGTAQALLAAIDALEMNATRIEEAEIGGIHEAWNSSWEADKSGMPNNEEVAKLISEFRAAGQSVVIGYGAHGKVPSASGKNAAWGIETNSALSAGKQLVSRAKDPWVQLTFIGNRVEFITEVATTACMIDVYLDGEKTASVDLSSTTNKRQESLYDSGSLPQGEHTLLLHAVSVGQASTVLQPYQIFRADAFKIYSDTETGNKAELAEAIAAAEIIDQTACTPETVSTFADALSAARAMLCREGASQQEIDAAKATLLDAQGKLTTKMQDVTAVTEPVKTVVAIGTEFAKLSLPETLIFRTASGSYKAPVTWNEASYDKNLIGEQTIAGELSLDAQKFQNPLHLKAQMVVQTTSSVEGITLSRATDSCSVGNSFRLTATLVPENAVIQTVYWTSTNSQVATVENGLVRGVREGHATIFATAADGGMSAKCEVTVYPAASGGSTTSTAYTITVKQSEGGKISPTTGSVEKGKDKTFTIKAGAGYTIKDVLVNGKSVGAVESYTFSNVTSNHAITAVFEKISAVRFADVKDTDWFADEVNWAVENGMMKGVGDDKFDPQGTATRAMILTMLYRQAGSPKETGSGAWYADAEKWAKETGISDGSNLTGEITREQLVTMLWRANNSPKLMDYEGLSKYADAGEISAWAQQAMAWAHQKGILSGKGQNNLDPAGAATRAETAAMFMRLSEKE